MDRETPTIQFTRAMPITIRLLLVDDHPVMRAGLANLLNSDPGFSVVGQANDGTQGVKL